eukprot:8542065-Alexandrium_andersonii.AAC.1
MAIVGLGAKTPLIIVSCYGWASSAAGEDICARTNALMGAILGELTEWPNLPCLIAGDLNAQTQQLPVL